MLNFKIIIAKTYKNKNDYYYSFKLKLKINSKQGSSHELKELTWVDS